MMQVGVDLAHGPDQANVCLFRRDASGGLHLMDMYRLAARTVSARRARKLRRAGVRCSFAGRTSTGKSRYSYLFQFAAAQRWMRCFDQLRARRAIL